MKLTTQVLIFFFSSQVLLVFFSGTTHVVLRYYSATGSRLEKVAVPGNGVNDSIWNFHVTFCFCLLGPK